jgi:hypothetical protein
MQFSFIHFRFGLLPLLYIISLLIELHQLPIIQSVQ